MSNTEWEYGYTKDGWWLKKNAAILWGNNPTDIRDYLNHLEQKLNQLEKEVNNVKVAK